MMEYLLICLLLSVFFVALFYVNPKFTLVPLMFFSQFVCADDFLNDYFIPTSIDYYDCEPVTNLNDNPCKVAVNKALQPRENLNDPGGTWRIEQIDIEMAYFTDMQIARFLVEAQDNGAIVHVFSNFDNIGQPAYDDVAAYLYDNGIVIDFRAGRTFGGVSGIYHKKVAYIVQQFISNDPQIENFFLTTYMTGSYNYTNSAWQNNAENLIVLSHLDTPTNKRRRIDVAQSSALITINLLGILASDDKKLAISASLGVTDCNSIQIKQAYKKSYCTACAEKLTSAGQ